MFLVPVVYDVARGSRATLLLTVILTVGAASALIGIVQYGVLNFDDLHRRPQGALSHWMTYSGTLMLVVCAAVVAAAVRHQRPDLGGADHASPDRQSHGDLDANGDGRRRRRRRRARCSAATSGSWRCSRSSPGVVIALAPASVTNRVYSIIDLNDPTSRDRVAMLQAGVAIVEDHPLTGVGPNQIERIYPAYRVPGAVQPSNPHLHNVPMQIAAERGLPALASWLWFVITAAVGLVTLLRRSRHRTLAAAGLGGLAAALAAGFFEYNFGDSEFLMLLLTMITLPFAANRDGGLPR